MKIMPGGRARNYLTRFGVFLTTAVLIIVMAGCGCDGSNQPPSQNLEIRDWYGLDDVRDNLSGNHILMNDLDSTTAGYTELASPTAHGGKGWQPVVILHPYGPTAYTGFMGTFDGQGYDKGGLFINRPDEGYVGLFGAVEGGGVIQNISVVNLSVIGDYDVGSLVGKNDGTLSNSCSSGNITGRSRVGGLSGSNTGTVSNSYCAGAVGGEWNVGGLVGDSEGVVSDSHFTGSATGSEYVGGLVGTNHDTVSKSHFTGEVTGSSFVGGLVGSNTLGDVFESYSTGNVTGYGYVGGLVGWNYGVVSNSCSTGSVTGTNCVGGLVAKNLDTVDNCYSTGAVTGDKRVGGLVGANYYDGIDRYATVSSSFWDIEISGQSTSSGGTGKNTTEMKSVAMFLDAGWNITAVALSETNLAYIWIIVDGVTYPLPSWEPVS